MHDTIEMGKIQLGVVNSRVRQWFQKYYEFGVLKRHLKRNGVNLSGSVVLDAGCGSGYSSALIIKEFHPGKLYALDITPEQVELAKQQGLPANITCGDIANTGFPAETFDAVFTFGVFHHVPKWDKALEEMNRVLKPGGLLLGGEIGKQKESGFEWSAFAAGLEQAGFSTLESENIYLGFFKSFMCKKPAASATGESQAEHATLNNPGTYAEPQRSSRSTLRWLSLWAIVLAVILVPFFLFGSQIEHWTQTFINSASKQPLLVATVLGSLLAIDILAPVPSSVISTAAGFLLGFARGLLTSSVGMIISCILGYWLAVKFGRLLASRIVGKSELDRLEEMSHRFGDWVVVVLRPVPVLAEASVMFAGLSQMPLHRFLLLSTLSNLGISAVYAAVGALSANVPSFLLAFAGAILVPLIAMLATWKRT
jgi:uncharacterized membrane protein YdjX (TVP38/TMEM64 family)